MINTNDLTFNSKTLTFTGKIAQGLCDFSDYLGVFVKSAKTGMIVEFDFIRYNGTSEVYEANVNGKVITVVLEA